MVNCKNYRYAWFLCLVCCQVAFAELPEIRRVGPAMSREQWRMLRELRREQPRNLQIGRFEKLELQVDLIAQFENPYNAEEIDLWAEFTSPTGKKFEIVGFYSPVSAGVQWLIRFAPTEVGHWQYVVKARDQEGEAEPSSGQFECTDSSHPGFIEIAPNQRYLRHTNGKTFFGVGLWYNDNYSRYGDGSITEQDLDLLKRFDANFICFFPNPLETRGTGLGRYDAARCGRLDEIFAWCEERDLKVVFNLIFHSHISEAIWGGFNAQYGNSPYRQIAPAEQVFQSDAVWKHQQNLNRYILARWGYSRALAMWFVIDEINGTEGWQTGGAESAEAWCRKMHDYFREHDPYRRPTTGTQSGGVDQWWPGGYQIFDVAAREIYEAQGHPMPEAGKPIEGEEHPLRTSYQNYAKQTQNLWHGFSKPCIIGECGWDHTYHEPGTPGYLAMVHNAQWATLACGSCMGPFWWSYSPMVNGSVVTNQLRTFARFVRDIELADKTWSPGKGTTDAADIFVMMAENEAFGWVAHPGKGIAGARIEISGLPENDDEYDIYFYRTWRGEFLEPMGVRAKNGKVEVSVPELRTANGQANHLGDDVAFRVLPKGHSWRP